MEQYAYLYNEIVMMLGKIMVIQCANKPQHVLAAGSTNSADGESALAVSCFHFHENAYLRPAS